MAGDVDGCEPIELSGLCNGGLELMKDHRQPPVGDQVFHGLPFQPWRLGQVGPGRPDLPDRRAEDRISHHHGEADHAAFLERPFLEALRRVRERLEQARSQPSEGDP